MDAKNFAEGLRQIADWYDANPDIDTPMSELTVFTAPDTKEQVATLARRLGPATKDMHDTVFALTRSFNGVGLRFVFLRSTVCERRVIGTEQVPEQVIPAHTKDIVEWDCHSILAD